MRETNQENIRKNVKTKQNTQIMAGQTITDKHARVIEEEQVTRSETTRDSKRATQETNIGKSIENTQNHDTSDFILTIIISLYWVCFGNLIYNKSYFRAVHL